MIYPSIYNPLPSYLQEELRTPFPLKRMAASPKKSPAYMVRKRAVSSSPTTSTLPRRIKYIASASSPRRNMNSPGRWLHSRVAEGRSSGAEGGSGGAKGRSGDAGRAITRCRGTVGWCRGAVKKNNQKMKKKQKQRDVWVRVGRLGGAEGRSPKRRVGSCGATRNCTVE